MTWAGGGWNQLRRVFRLPPTRHRVRNELDDELRFHLEGRIEDLMDREGLSRSDAEREARRRFGDYQAYRSQARSIDDRMLERRNRMELLDTVLRETRHAFHSLRRAPAFSLIALLTLALGLGAATTIFTVLDRVVLRPLPYSTAERLLHIGTLWPKVKAGSEYGVSRGQFFNLKKNSRALSNIGFYDTFSLAIPGDGDHPSERVPIISASASLFDVLGIRPEKGRLFTAEENLKQQAGSALITHGYWVRRFGSDPTIVGKRIELGGDASYEIVGVLPAGSGVPEFKGDVWLPAWLDPATPPQNEHTHHAIGLLATGVTVNAAAADIRRLQDAFAAAYPNIYPASFIERVGFAMNTTSLRDHVLGPSISRALWIIFAAVGVVLLIAAANVANLFLVRIDARRREMVVRAALGAGRRQLALHYLAESLLLSFAAGLCAVALGYGLLRAVLLFVPQSLPRLDEVHFNAASVVFCIAGALVFGVVFGLLPLGARTLDLATLREGGRGMTTSQHREFARRGLVISQVAMAIVLLSAAGLMVKSFMNLRNVKPGFDPVGVHTMTIVVPYVRYGDYRTVVQFYHELSKRVEALPGVGRAAFTDALPLDGDAGCSVIGTDAGRNTPADAQCMPLIAVSPGYFETMGITVTGLSPTWSDVEALHGPVVVSRAFSKRFWADDDPVGHYVRPFNATKFPQFPVVGVASDVRQDGVQNPPIEAAYLPILPTSGWSYWNVSHAMTFVVRAPSVDQRALAASVRRIVTQIDPAVPVANVVSMETVVAQSMAQTSFTMLLLLMASGIALVLSAVGIYGVIAYVVGQRRGEIGIRMALGAQIAEVARMVVGQSLRLATIGALVGVVAALASMQLLRSLLFQVRPTDPLTLIGTCVALLFIAVLASVGPARRAAKVDPVEAMRG